VADLCTGGYASGSSGGAPESWPQAFDDDFTSTKWLADNPYLLRDNFLYARAQLSASATVISYQMVSGDDAPERDPQDWTIQGSNDASTWVILDTQTLQTFASRGLTKTYNFSNSISYAYYKLSITKLLNIASDLSATQYMQLAEWRLWTGSSGTGTNVALTATMTSPTPYSGQPVTYLNDGNTSTKWLMDLGALAGTAWWISYRLTAAAAINKYTITSGNDSPPRDPANWVLQGSFDGAIWFDADTRAWHHRHAGCNRSARHRAN
jgi:hypothetical protein